VTNSNLCPHHFSDMASFPLKMCVMFFKVSDYRVILKGVCHFLLVVNSNLSPISREPFPRYGQFTIRKRTFFLTPIHSTPNL